MPTPSNLQNLDERGYVFVTDAADCQILASQITVDDSAAPTPIPQDATGNPRNLPGRRRIYLKNFNAAEGDTVYIGDASVTTATGYPIVAQDELILDITDNIQLYAIVASTESADLRMLELA